MDGDARLHGADERQLPPCGAPDDGGGQRVRRAPLDGRRQLQQFRLVVARRRQAVRDLQTSSGGHRRGERQERTDGRRRLPRRSRATPGSARPADAECVLLCSSGCDAEPRTCYRLQHVLGPKP